MDMLFDVSPSENEGYPACHVFFTKGYVTTWDDFLKSYPIREFMKKTGSPHRLFFPVFVHQSYWFQLSIPC